MVDADESTAATFGGFLSEYILQFAHSDSREFFLADIGWPNDGDFMGCHWVDR